VIKREVNEGKNSLLLGCNVLGDLPGTFSPLDSEALKTQKMLRMEEKTKKKTTTGRDGQKKKIVPSLGFWPGAKKERGVYTLQVRKAN